MGPRRRAFLHYWSNHGDCRLPRLPLYDKIKGNNLWQRHQDFCVPFDKYCVLDPTVAVVDCQLLKRHNCITGKHFLYRALFRLWFLDHSRLKDLVLEVVDEFECDLFRCNFISVKTTEDQFSIRATLVELAYFRVCTLLPIWIEANSHFVLWAIDDLLDCGDGSVDLLLFALDVCGVLRADLFHLIRGATFVHLRL